jgi:hypothetical protein
MLRGKKDQWLTSHRRILNPLAENATILVVFRPVSLPENRTMRQNGTFRWCQFSTVGVSCHNRPVFGRSQGPEVRKAGLRVPTDARLRCGSAA